MPQLHPRIAEHQRYWQRRRDALRRLAPGILSSRRAMTDRPFWVDYYPWAPGTIPEKMVFAELARRQITFFFAPYWGDMPLTQDVYEHYRPDFVLPEYRIVIEVFGAYWHTLEGQAEKDAQKAMMYEASGYHHYVLWDYQIFASVAEAVDTIPELVNPSVRTGHIYVSDRPFDPRSSLQAQRTRGPKVIRLKVRGPSPAARVRKPLSVRKPHLHAPRRPKPSTGPGFHGLGDDYLKEIRGYSEEWKGYVEQLGDFFDEYGARAQKAYGEQYTYWLQWKEYWTRWQKVMTLSQDYRDWIDELGRYFRMHPESKWWREEEYYAWLAWRSVDYRTL